MADITIIYFHTEKQYWYRRSV